MSKKTKINVQGTEITILCQNDKDYISLTDMVKNFDGGSSLIENWLKNKDTILFLGVWEQINNADFNSPEFEGIKNDGFLNNKNYTRMTQGSGYPVQSFCEKVKRIYLTIPHANLTTL